MKDPKKSLKSQKRRAQSEPFFEYQNHTLDVWFGKNYIVEQKKKPPVRIELRSVSCNLE